MSVAYNDLTIADVVVFSGSVTGTPTAQLYVNGVATGSAVNGTGSGTTWTFSITLSGLSIGATVRFVAIGVVSGITQRIDIFTGTVFEVYSLTTISNQSPVADSGLLTGPIVIGDDYLDANDRAFIWYITPLEATFATCTTKFGGVDEQGNTWTVTGTMAEVEIDGDDKWSLSFDMPEAVTELLEVGKAKWSVAVYTATSDQITVARGSVQVVLAYTEAV